MLINSINIPRQLLVALNQLYEIEQKLRRHGDPAHIQRNIEKIKAAYSDGGLFYEDPMGQPFNETRTDLEATISGADTSSLVVVEVIKPIIRAGKKEFSTVVQRGIVVVEKDNSL